MFHVKLIYFNHLMYKVGIFLAIYWIMFGKLRFIYFESTFYCTVMVLGFSQGNLVPVKIYSIPVSSARIITYARTPAPIRITITICYIMLLFIEQTIRCLFLNIEQTPELFLLQFYFITQVHKKFSSPADYRLSILLLPPAFFTRLGRSD